MGGFGSGRRSGLGRDTVEYFRSIDVNRLHKTGCLDAGWAGGWQWTFDGSWINLRAEPDRLCLSRAHQKRRRLGGRGRTSPHRSRRLSLRRHAAHFYCPVSGVVRGRRVAKVHPSGRYFLCRDFLCRDDDEPTLLPSNGKLKPIENAPGSYVKSAPRTDCGDRAAKRGPYRQGLRRAATGSPASENEALNGP